MPTHMISLVGRRTGDAEVRRILRRETYAGKAGYIYDCHCHRCGSDFEAHQSQIHLGRVTSCTPCKYKRQCQQCGKTFSSKLPRATCSEACKTSRRREQWLEHYYRATAADPDHNRRRAEAIKKRLAADPALAAAVAEAELHRGRRRRERMTDAQREEERQLSRKRYAENKEAILAERRRRREERGPEFVAEQRRWARAWWAENGARIQAERRAKYRENAEASRAYARQWRLERRAALAAAEMKHVAEELRSRFGNDPNGDGNE